MTNKKGNLLKKYSFITNFVMNLRSNDMSVSPFLQSIHEFVEDKKILDKSGPVIVGVSGGADSIALLHVLKSLGYSCIVCHCNFNLRG